MSAQLRVGIAGIRHGHAKTLVNQWREVDNVQIVAAADEFESARSLARDTWFIPNIYETWQELLDREDLDVVTATLPNTQHADVVDSVAALGLQFSSKNLWPHRRQTLSGWFALRKRPMYPQW